MSQLITYVNGLEVSPEETEVEESLSDLLYRVMGGKEVEVSSSSALAASLRRSVQLQNDSIK